MESILFRYVLLLSIHSGVFCLKHYPLSTEPTRVLSTFDGPRFEAEWLTGPYLGFPGEVDIQCTDREPTTYCQGGDFRPTRNETVKTAHTILRWMRNFCIGDSWNGEKCWSLLNDFRDVAHREVKAWASGHSELHVDSMCGAPRVLHWQSGGGLRANVKCGSKSDRSFFYRHNWKVGGWAIEANMAENAGYNESRGEDDWWTNSRCTQYDNLKVKDSPMLFTFVRNPVMKFLAGYKEICVRNENTVFKTLRNNSIGTADHATTFLDMMFHGNCDNPHILAQHYILTNKACESKFDFIGKLEQFDSDWAELSRRGGCPQTMKWSDDYPKHDSQDPEYDKYELAMQRALKRNNNALFKALCWWMLPDFVIFDYELPHECASDASLRRVVSMAMRDNHGFVGGA